jgi:hypothetical protein
MMPRPGQGDALALERDIDVGSERRAGCREEARELGHEKDVDPRAVEERGKRLRIVDVEVELVGSLGRLDDLAEQVTDERDGGSGALE